MTHHPEVPSGPYCYDERGLCPHWSIRDDKPEQENGYCALMEVGDWMPLQLGTVLLWDQVKECGINLDEEGDFEAEWAALPRGEGVTPTGESLFPTEPPSEERIARAWATMDRLTAEAGLPPYEWGPQGKSETTPFDPTAYGLPPLDKENDHG